MTALAQRDPRQRDPAFLAFLRQHPCCVCGKPGPSDPCHIRMANLVLGKRYTGKGEKPHDRYSVPMCRPHHDEQHSMSESKFWQIVMLNPFKIAHDLYQIGKGTVTTRKPRARVRIVGSRKIVNGKTTWSKRTIPSRPFQKRQALEAAQ